DVKSLAPFAFAALRHRRGHTARAHRRRHARRALRGKFPEDLRDVFGDVLNAIVRVLPISNPLLSEAPPYQGAAVSIHQHDYPLPLCDFFSLPRTAVSPSPAVPSPAIRTPTRWAVQHLFDPEGSPWNDIRVGMHGIFTHTARLELGGNGLAR